MKNSLVREQIRQQGISTDGRNEQSQSIGSDEHVSSRHVLQKNSAVAPGTSQEIEERKAIEEEQIMMDEESMQELKKIRHKKLVDKLKKYSQVFLALCCAYLVFLIYGVVNTNFTYNSRGEVVPMITTVDSIRETNDFETFKTQYIQARILYEKVLVYDYRLGMGMEDPLLIAPEYEKTLNDISSLSVQIGAITAPAKYTQPMNMLLSWVQNDIALYCQYMSRAITQNNPSDANKATSYKEIMYNNFMQITQVAATLGSSVENADISDIVSWTPETYIRNFTEGGV